MHHSSLSGHLEELAASGLLTMGQARRIGLAAELAKDPGGVLSGQTVGDFAHLSRAAIHKQVEQLRSLGFAIEPVGGAGYRLAQPFDDLVAAEAVIPLLLELLEPCGLLKNGGPWIAGLPYRYVASCPSTNQALRTAAAAPRPAAHRGPATLPAGAVVVTDEQTGGRGRLGRGWVSQPGRDLTFSVLLRPALAPARAHLLSLAAALAVAETLETIPGLEGQVGIKWPNDVLLGDRKVCGILVEGSMDSDRLHWAVAGIGLNVNSDPGAFTRGVGAEALQEWAGRPEPASLSHALATNVPRAPLLAQLLARLTERWRDVEGGDLPGLRQRDLLRGRVVEVLSGPPANAPVASGEAAGIGEEGQLFVRTEDGRTAQLFAGDVTVRSFSSLP
jgi:BirA family transcriptional regulator, biotin operon repressor / biotin---[acetyl-CoA-carboxylase] ligase